MFKSSISYPGTKYVTASVYKIFRWYFIVEIRVDKKPIEKKLGERIKMTE
jgi:hypothetical protein